MTTLKLKYNLKFADLYSRDGLIHLDARFVRFIKDANADLHNRLVKARLMIQMAGKNIDKQTEAQLLIDLAPYVEDFIGQLFGIKKNLARLSDRIDDLAPIYRIKRQFVQRIALKKYKAEEAETFDATSLQAQLEERFEEDLTELSFASHVETWMEDETRHEDNLDLAARYAAWASLTKPGYKKHIRGVLFKHPQKIDKQNLVPLETTVIDGITVLKQPDESLRKREGFKLTDDGCDLNFALDQMQYCIKCHERDKDSCSTGLKDKTSEDYIHDELENDLVGCPLDQKISEMHVAAERGHMIGALSIICVDNPMVAATGHRICNDCMKACIFQKQDPVDIPQAETRILKEVLDLPWGFEIYSLLTRWNPLDLKRPLPKPQSDYKVLIVGMGPSGFTLAHHLLNEGHAVAGIDGLKIEPLDQPFKPIKNVANLYENLDDRKMAGFGGVAEYGITVRWDKNFLKIIRLLLERRELFRMYGGVRFGGTLTIDQAFEMGFDHIALCAGAGKPTVLPIPNGLARGVRTASDFLMALQLTGAAKQQSLANLQVRLPLVVVGGGLTAIDTATEALAYYPQQVEKFLARFEILTQDLGEEAVWQQWSEEEREIAQEFLDHAKALRAEKQKESPDVLGLLKQWGGVTIAYRQALQMAPSYRLNHEEVVKAFEEGIHLTEGLSPKQVEVDEYGKATGLTLTNQHSKDITLPARTILIAAGTQPNTVIGREYPERFSLHGRFFDALDKSGQPVKVDPRAKPKEVHILVNKREDDKAISYFGDMHPSFHGKVVKAMGSAKQGYPLLCQILKQADPHVVPPAVLFDILDRDLRTHVHQVKRLNPFVMELTLHAPMAARNFEPGQFFRLQNYESSAHHVFDTSLCMEGIALTGARVDKEKGLITCIVREVGGSTELCRLLQPGDPVVLMGPTGKAVDLPKNKTVLLAGGGAGNINLLTIGQKLKQQGNKIIYFAHYTQNKTRFWHEEIEDFADQIIWCSEEKSAFSPDRPQDAFYQGNLNAAINDFAQTHPNVLKKVDHLMVITAGDVMQNLQAALAGPLQQHFKKNLKASAAIHSPMQCMMKEVCAQCLQSHTDPKTGKTEIVFSCFNQDQPLHLVDFDVLHGRLRQNSVQEKLTRLWIEKCLKELGEDKIAA